MIEKKVFYLIYNFEIYLTLNTRFNFNRVFHFKGFSSDFRRLSNAKHFSLDSPLAFGSFGLFIYGFSRLLYVLANIHFISKLMIKYLFINYSEKYNIFSHTTHTTALMEYRNTEPYITNDT